MTRWDRYLRWVARHWSLPYPPRGFHEGFLLAWVAWQLLLLPAWGLLLWLVLQR